MKNKIRYLYEIRKDIEALVFYAFFAVVSVIMVISNIMVQAWLGAFWSSLSFSVCVLGVVVYFYIHKNNRKN